MRGELLLSHASIKLHVPKIQKVSLVEKQHLASDEAIIFTVGSDLGEGRDAESGRERQGQSSAGDGT